MIQHESFQCNQSNENEKDKSSSLLETTDRMTYLLFLFADHSSHCFDSDEALTASCLCENQSLS
jgi:hypothetical protein